MAGAGSYRKVFVLTLLADDSDDLIVEELYSLLRIRLQDRRGVLLALQKAALLLNLLQPLPAPLH